MTQDIRNIPWRVGTRHGIHIYAGDYPGGEPVATAMSKELAERIVQSHNACLPETSDSGLFEGRGGSGPGGLTPDSGSC